MPAEPLFQNGYLRIRSCRHGLMLFNTHDQYIGRSLDEYGEYAEAELYLLDKFLRPGDTVIDVGANIGTHSVFFAKKVGPTGMVISFEPQPVIFQMLCANMVLNGLEQGRPRNMAVGAAPGFLDVSLPRYDAPNNFGGIPLTPRQNGRRITICTLDQEEYPAVALIKVDVEGMETDVLVGAAATIARHRPVLYLECSPSHPRSRETIGHILGLDYRIYRHLPQLFNPQNHYAKAENLFPQIVSANVLCLPRERPVVVSDTVEITSPEQWPDGSSGQAG